MNRRNLIKSMMVAPLALLGMKARPPKIEPIEFRSIGPSGLKESQWIASWVDDKGIGHVRIMAPNHFTGQPTLTITA